MLFSLFAKPPKPVDTRLPLQNPVLPMIDTSGFQRGIDNVRIDVAFGETLTRTLRQLVDETIAMVMKQHEGKKQWLQPSKPQGHLLVKFHKAYVRTMESAIYQAKNEENEQLIWLARLAILTHVVDFIDERLERKSHDLKRLTAQGASGRHDEGKQVALQNQSSWLTRHHSRLRDYLLAILLQQISTSEWGKVSKLSHALLNVMERDFIKSMLDNPVLRANKPDDTWMLVQSYMLPPHADSSNNQESIVLINQSLDAIFADIHVADDDAGYHLNSDDLPYDAASFFADVENVGVDLDWRDMRDNITQLFAAKGKAEMYGILRNMRNDEEKQKLQEENNIRVGCQKLLLHVIKQAGMQKAIKASFKANTGYQAVGGALTHRQVYEYFLGGAARRGIRQKIKSMGKVLGDNPDTLFKALDKVEDPHEGGETLAFRFLSTFVHYRHDLKIALLMKKHLLRIHILQSDDDHRLSKANGVLYHFSSDEGAVVSGADIIGHAIIKADVRGSVGITKSLRDKGLNPATHFSRTFFDPISDLLPAYGAEKVFVEGDAIILSLMEYSTDPQHMAVARACGLSREILRIVENNNEENRRNNLPILELGIGVVYLTEAPAFLFDGDHKITISPAIGRSDRLSSCSKVVRPVLEKAADHDPLRHTDVFAISEDGKSKNDKGEVHLRYNVDGIDLDSPAFMKLTKEISLKPIDVRLFGGKVKERYYVGRFKDNKGYLRFLAIRQGRIRLWDEEQANRKFLPKQYYFEVIGDRDRLSQLESQFAS